MDGECKVTVRIRNIYRDGKIQTMEAGIRKSAEFQGIWGKKDGKGGFEGENSFFWKFKYGKSEQKKSLSSYG
jgi:hypothetical protein